ncbi:MAG: DUF5716 family protein [Eubacteriales bacterium]|nr:DUF5716 family protein [Eubacteriales bacterium]
MNEIRDLIVGLDFGRETTQICYYDRKAQEPRSLSMKVGSSQYEAPTCLTRKADKGEFVVGLEARFFADEKNGLEVPELYELCGTDQPILLGDDEVLPHMLAAEFLKGMLAFLGVMDVVNNTSCLVITCPEFNATRVENLKKACKALGFPENRFLMIDYGESFYYYAMTQHKEPLSRSVAWYDFKGNKVKFRRLLVNRRKTPLLAMLSATEEMILPETPELRDKKFCEFIESTLSKKEMYSSVQLTGNGFSQDWAKEAVKLLCFQKRKVFYGNNLYARGACAAGKERKEDRNFKNYRFLSDSRIQKDIGMEMQVMGSPTYVPLIEGGNNWYECKSSCELILDQTRDLIFIESTLGDSEKKRVSMPLPGLPERPNKTTRLKLDLEFISPKECTIRVEDLGFGEMFPSSGAVWVETFEW